MSIILAKEEKTLLLVENGPFLSYFGCFFCPRPKKKFVEGKCLACLKRVHHWRKTRAELSARDEAGAD